jgi:hypothetical protein
MFFAIVLLTAGFLSALSAPRPAQRAVKPPPQAVVSPPAETRGTLPADKVVHASVGDIVVLTITSETFDTAQLEDLGLSVDVAPNAPGTLEFLAGNAGRFPVTLEASRRAVGQLVVDDG